MIRLKLGIDGKPLSEGELSDLAADLGRENSERLSQARANNKIPVNCYTVKTDGQHLIFRKTNDISNIHNTLTLLGYDLFENIVIPEWEYRGVA